MNRTEYLKTRAARPMTQLEFARGGVVSEEMRAVADKERLAPETVRDEIAAGRLVIPANPGHVELDPCGIGIAVTTKINANIGASPLSSCLKDEVEKLETCIRYGADAVMDLSTGGNLQQIREAIIHGSTVPVGTVPVYEALERVQGDIALLTPEILMQVIRDHAAQGVDFMTIHAGLLRRHLPLTKTRLTGVVSRGGSILMQWMVEHGAENPLYERFDEIAAVFREHDVTFSLGDGLRPGSLADAGDPAQYAELDVLGELTARAWKAGCQVMVEGPGHIPFSQVPAEVEREQRVCHGAPFYVLGPIVTDIAPGYDHITSAIGATAAATAGASFLCYVTPKEHLGLPDLEDVRTGIVTYRIAAHAADVARRRPGARERDDAMSRARFDFDWKKQFSLALDPDRAREYHDATVPQAEGKEYEYCSMCGPDYCSMRKSRKLREKIES